MCSWCQLSVEVVSQLVGSRPAAALWDMRDSSVSAVDLGSDAWLPQMEPSAPASPAPAGGAAVTLRPETATLLTRQQESEVALMGSTKTPAGPGLVPSVLVQMGYPAR